MNSALYFGEVSHQRKSPKAHQFKYRLYMPHLFLDELNEVFRGRWLWSTRAPNLSYFRRSDYHKPEVSSLEDAVRSTMSEQIGRPVTGPISVLTHLRTFGYCFNPVTFYYEWNENRDQPTALMAEITNTPWHEKYAKAFSWSDSESGDSNCTKQEFRKEFHVSPFIDMGVEYDWRFKKPDEKLRVDMMLKRTNEVFFSAHLNLRKKPINSFTLGWSLLRFPLLTFRITFGIYWQALLLRLKGCPFYAHPKHAASATTHD